MMVVLKTQNHSVSGEWDIKISGDIFKKVEYSYYIKKKPENKIEVIYKRIQTILRIYLFLLQ